MSAFCGFIDKFRTRQTTAEDNNVQPHQLAIPMLAIVFILILLMLLPILLI
jgi:hypothetical protein